MLNWASQFNIFCFLDNNQYNFNTTSFECLLAVGQKNSITLDYPTDFNQLKFYSEKNKDWLFGHISYPSHKKDEIDFPNLFFFTPLIVIQIQNNQVKIEGDTINPKDLFDTINSFDEYNEIEKHQSIDIQHQLTEEEYLEKINSILQHIQRGDCYELNFCQEFSSHQVKINPYHIYSLLNKKSPNPFSALYKLNDRFCLCASPERFLKRADNTVISQPIKGTSKRDLQNPKKDLLAKEYLINSEKEKSENVMIVDLVRNDLSKVCKEGSVNVSELFGIYSFPQVHQMISTIQGEVEPNCSWTEIVEACFPMGSMTGAPKKRVTELIDLYESAARGLFSGCIGYVAPDGDFDFNVVIRSIFYNQTKAYLSFKAGSGITFNSNPQEEYNECKMKIEAIRKIFE